MRIIYFVLAIFLAISGVLSAGQSQPPQRTAEFSLADLLPANTLVYLNPPNRQALQADYDRTVLKAILSHPEFASFFQSVEMARRNLVQQVIREVNVRPEFVESLMEGHLSGALIGVGMGRDGRPVPTYVVAIRMAEQPDRQMVFSSIQAILNRPDIIQFALKSSGVDPNIPLKSLVQEESLPGCPPTLRVGGELRIAVLGNLVLIYGGPTSEGLREILTTPPGSGQVLSRSPLYQSAYRGSETKPGMGFLYINSSQLITLAGLMNMPSMGGVIDSLGITGVQAIGYSSGYHMEGMRNNLYFHSPGNRQGLLASILDNPGVEQTARTIPAQAGAFMAARLDMQSFFHEIPYLMDALSQPRPGGSSGLRSLLAEETLPGATIADLITSLGDEIVILPHDDTMILRFDNADLNAFTATVRKIEQASGRPWRQITEGAYPISYFVSPTPSSLPLMPAYCAWPRQQTPGRGVVYVASHPQTIASFIRQASQNREQLARTPDCQRVMQGMGEGYSAFFYADCRDSYQHVYNALLPLGGIYSSSSPYAADLGLLPSARTFAGSLFGCAIGAKANNQGVLLTSYSPFGMTGFFTWVADKLTLSNPAVLGYLATRIYNSFAVPAYGVPPPQPPQPQLLQQQQRPRR